MASAQVCPVVGTTNNVLPPTHPEVNLALPGQTCPITNATTDHHIQAGLIKHPNVPISGTGVTQPSGASKVDANACPVLKTQIQGTEEKKLDEEVCPVVGPVTSVLPPDHPSTANAKEGDVCPVTLAKVSHHKGVVHQHPSVSGGAAQCPVVGAKA